uniref:Calx-beta domain-containing protein n=1 Tax=Mariniflexile sp. TaxID=1979402 RepID=UPI0040484BAB
GDLVVYAKGSEMNGHQSFSLWEIDQETQQSLLLDSNSVLGGGNSSSPTFTFHSIPEWVNTFPELHLTAEVDAATGLIDIKTDWTGDVSAITYSVLVDGGQVVEYDLKDYPNEWLLAANFYNESSNAEVYLSATGSDVITGISDLLSMSVTPLSDTRDLRISLSPANISYAETPDIDDVLDREVSYTVKFGADVSALSATVSQMEGSESDTWIEYEIALDRAVDVDHELSWTLISTGSYGVNAADFEGNALPNGVVSFAAGETEGLIRFQVAADGMVEHDETFELVLTPSNGLNVSALGTLSGTLVNDDKAAVSVTGDSVLLPEGDSGITSYTFDVELDQAAFGEQSVDWAVELIDGEASLADFSGDWSGTVTFAEGETSKQITLGVVGDIEKEGREDFRIKVTPQSEDILVDIDAGVLDVQIKDDDGYDLGGQVYFWGGLDKVDKYLMDGVDVALTAATGNTPEALYANVLNLKNLKLDADSGRSSAELWTDFTDVSQISFTMEVPQGGAFESKLGSAWAVTQDYADGVLSFTANWTGSGVQTQDRLDLGRFTMDTPQLGQEVQLSVLSASQSNAAGQTKANAGEIAMTMGYESQTSVSNPADASDGAYLSTSLLGGSYQVMLDKEFEVYSIEPGSTRKDYAAEVNAIDSVDVRLATLMAAGKLSGVSEEAIIAADVDGSGVVDSVDVRYLTLMAASREPYLEAFLDWTFVSEGAVLSGVDYGHVEHGVDWEQGSSILLDDDAAHQNLVAILRGDIDGSYKPEDDLILFA